MAPSKVSTSARGASLWARAGVTAPTGWSSRKSSPIRVRIARVVFMGRIYFYYKLLYTGIDHPVWRGYDRCT